MHKINATSLTYLYHQCKRCWWLDRHKIWTRPNPQIASMFTAIDGLMRKAYDGKPFSALVPNLGNDATLFEGVTIAAKKKRIKSLPILLEGCSNPAILSGEMDMLCECPDGDVGITELKSSKASPCKVEIYKPQLYVYREIAMNPEKGLPRNVKFMGLVFQYPTDNLLPVTASGHPVVELGSHWEQVAIDPEWWKEFLTEAVMTLEGDEPSPTADCYYCELANAQMAKSTVI